MDFAVRSFCLVVVIFLACYMTTSDAAESRTQPSDCDKVKDELSIVVDKMLVLIDPDFKGFPTKQHLQREYCSKIDQWNQPIKKYRRCLKGFQRSLYVIIANRIRKIQKDICSTDEKIDEAYNHAKCVTNDTLPVIKHLAYQVRSLFTTLSAMESRDDIIPGLCCGMHSLIDVIRPKLHEICTPRTGPKTPDYLIGLVNQVFSDVLDIMCGRYPSLEKCKELQPEVTKKIYNAFATAKPSKTPIFDRFLMIMSQFDEAPDL